MPTWALILIVVGSISFLTALSLFAYAFIIAVRTTKHESDSRVNRWEDAMDRWETR